MVTSLLAEHTHGLSAAVAAAAVSLGQRPDVLRVGAGYRVKDGAVTKEPAVVVVVPQKLPLATLHKQGTSVLPTHIGEFAIDVASASVQDVLAVALSAAICERGHNYVERTAKKFSLDRFREPMQALVHLSPDAGRPLPAHASSEGMAQRLGLPTDQSPTRQDVTVGELYEQILSGFQTIPPAPLFVGSEDRQIGQDVVDFRDMIKITDATTAAAAIQMIAQGEGASREDMNCHFGLFLRVLEEFEAECAASGNAFAPVRTVAENPTTRVVGFEGGHGVSLIENPIPTVSPSTSMRCTAQ